MGLPSLVPRPSHRKRERVWEIGLHACAAEEFVECNFVNREALSASASGSVVIT